MDGRKKRGHMKRKLLAGVMVAVLAALVGINSTEVSAQQTSQLWSVAVHLEYANGDSYDYVFARGVPTSTMTSILADCGRSHWTGFVVRYYCYPIPD
jgi:hypothetical protein